MFYRVLANRLALDTQGRLVLRENGKIVLPYEHFANAVMLKHMTGPHGLHLSVDATVRSVVESYTIGRENFGMEKEFILEVVQSCPNPACRYYKTHMGAGTPYMDAAFQTALAGQTNADFLQHLPQLQAAQQQQQQQSALLPSAPLPPSSSSSSSSTGLIDITQMDSSISVKQFQQSAQALSQLQQAQQQQSSSAAAQLQQQRSAVAAAAAAAAAAEKHLKLGQAQQQQITAAIIQQQNRAIAQQNLEKFSNMSAIEKQRVLQQLDKKQFDSSMVHNESSRSHERTIQPAHLPSRSHTPQLMGNVSPLDLQQSHKLNEFNMKSSNSDLTVLDSPTNKDLLALHNGAWGAYQQQSQQLQNLSTRENQTAALNLNHHQSQQQPQQQQYQGSNFRFLI